MDVSFHCGEALCPFSHPCLKVSAKDDGIIFSWNSRSNTCALDQHRIPSSRDFDDIDPGKMSYERPLQGACYCGRNRYLIVVPENATEGPQVIFDVSSENRTIQADLRQKPSLLTSSLRTFTSCTSDCMAAGADFMVSVSHPLVLP